MNAAHFVVTVECKTLFLLRVLCSFHVQLSSWRHFAKLFEPPHNRMAPLCLTIDEPLISSGKLNGSMVVKSPKTSAVEIEYLPSYPPAVIMQLILSENDNGSCCNQF